MGFLDRLLGPVKADKPDDMVSDDATNGDVRRWTNHAGGYLVCIHMGCKKKTLDSITEHDCCGRCRLGREHILSAMASYAGPGLIFHRFSEAISEPGLCSACGEAKEVH